MYKLSKRSLPPIKKEAFLATIGITVFQIAEVLENLQEIKEGIEIARKASENDQGKVDLFRHKVKSLGKLHRFIINLKINDDSKYAGAVNKAIVIVKNLLKPLDQKEITMKDLLKFVPYLNTAIFMWDKMKKFFGNNS